MSRRIQILRRATEMFERQGVSRTSIEDIANAVGIKREGVYYYFKSRADILLKIILPQSTSLVMALTAIINSNQSASAKLEAAIRSHLDRFNPSYLEMTVALREDHFLEDEGKAAELRNVWNEYTRLWTRLIVEGQE
ncbi:MAG: TetR/AcrR family transcriptional regulator, partial [Magnetospirillum sp.]|nr:TetR/AcrR family transcriptional regulator [Magnetospirillum sp.]